LQTSDREFHNQVYKLVQAGLLQIQQWCFYFGCNLQFGRLIGSSDML